MSKGTIDCLSIMEELFHQSVFLPLQRLILHLVLSLVPLLSQAQDSLLRDPARGGELCQPPQPQFSLGALVHLNLGPHF